jgi:hypothetical protein
MREHVRGEDADDPLAGRRAVHVGNSPAGVAAFEPEPRVEADAQLGEIYDPRGRLLREHVHRARPRETPPGRERVLGVEDRAVVNRERSRDPTLGEVARRRPDGAL